MKRQSLYTVVLLVAIASCGTGEDLEVEVTTQAAQVSCTVQLAATPTSVTIGQPVRLDATVENCGTGWTTQFFYKRTGSPLALTDGLSAPLTYTHDTSMLIAGSYQYSVVVALGNKKWSNTANVTLADTAVACSATKLAVPTSNGQIEVGLPTALTATSTCPAGAVAEYQFSARTSNATPWVVVSPYAQGNGSWTPATTGSWQLMVAVRAVGSNAPYQAQSNSTNVDVVQTHFPPNAADDAIVTTEDTPASLNLLANDSDPDGDAFSITSNTTTSHGALSIANGVASYTPAANYNGSDSFSYTITDARGRSDSASVAITVQAVNDAPVASNASATTPQATPVDVSLTASDVEGEAFTFQIANGPANGTASITGAQLHYAPAPSFFGTDTITIVARDGSSTSVPATVTITVVAAVCGDGIVNRGAGEQCEDGNSVDGDGCQHTCKLTCGGVFATRSVVADNGNCFAGYDGRITSYAVAREFCEGQSGGHLPTITSNSENLAMFAAEGGLANRSWLGLTDSDTEGTFVWDTGETFDFNRWAPGEPNNHQGNEDCAMIYYDGGLWIDVPCENPYGFIAGTVCEFPASGTENRAPVAVADAATTNEDTVVSFSLIANDHDADGDALDANLATSPSHGTVVISSGIATYTPAQDYAGTDSFSYQLSDGRETATATVTITIAAVNDVPVASNGSATTPQATPVDVGLTATDVEGEALTFQIVDGPANGTASITDAQLHYAPTTSFFGTDTIAIVALDGSSTSAPATITIAVVAAACGDSIINRNAGEECEDGNSTDGDGCQQNCKLTCGSGTGATRASVDATTGNCFAFYPGNYNFVYDQARTFCADKQAHLPTIQSLEENEAAFAATGGSSVWLGMDDIDHEGDFRWYDGETLAYTNWRPGEPNNYSGSENCAAFYNDHQWIDFECDNNPGYAESTLCEFPAPGGENRAPVAVDDTASTNEDTTVTFSVLANDHDADGDALTATVASSGGHGKLAIVDGIATYTPGKNYFGTDWFTYVLSDGKETATATVTITIASVNDVPRANADTIAVEEDGEAQLDVLANDTDADGDTLTVTLVDAPSHGSVSFAGSVATYRPTANYNGVDAFTYQVSDGNGGTAIGTVDIAVAAVNDAPVAQDDSFALVEDQPITFDAVANDTDLDGDALTITHVEPASLGAVTFNGREISYTPSPNAFGADQVVYTIDDGHGGTATAVVQFTIQPVNDLPVAVDDVLTVDEDNSITADLVANDSDVDHDLLTIVNTTPPAHGSVTFGAGPAVYTPAPGYNGPDAFAYTIADGHGGLASAQVSVTVSAVNDPVTANDDHLIVNEDESGIATVVANDSDGDGDTLLVVEVTPPSHGIVMPMNDRIEYRPQPNYFGADSFTYTVTDGNGSTATATVTVDVRSVNDRPSAADINASTPQATPVVITLQATDVESSAFTFAWDAPANGTVEQIAPNQLRYTPATTFSGVDELTYTADDGEGGHSAPAMIAITVVAAVCGDGIVNFNAGEECDDSNTTDHDGCEATCKNSCGGPLATRARIEPTTGNCFASYDGRELTYDNAKTFCNDHGGGHLPTLTTAAENATMFAALAGHHAWVGADDTATEGTFRWVTGETYAFTRWAPGEPNDHLGAEDCAVMWYGDSTWIDAPCDNWPHYAESTVCEFPAPGAENLAPTAVADEFTTDQDAGVLLDVLANDSDLDGDALTIVSTTPPTHGSISIAGNAIRYQPESHFWGTDAFTYTISDGKETATATVSMTVVHVNYPPDAMSDDLVVDEDGEATIDVLANDSDPDGTPIVLTDVTASFHGTVDIVAGGVRYRPLPNYNGPDQVFYTITDIEGATATGSINIYVTPVPDAPIASPDALVLDEDGAAFTDVALNDVEIDGEPLHVTGVVQPQHGTVTVFENYVTYTPNANYFGSDHFTYAVANESGVSSVGDVDVTVSPIDDMPIANNDSATTNEDEPVSIDVLSNDVELDGDTLTILMATLDDPEARATVSVAGDHLELTPYPDAYGTFTVSYRVTDATGNEATATALVTVHPVPDAPIARDDAETTPEDTTLLIHPLDNDSNPDDPTDPSSSTGLTIASVSAGSPAGGGTVTKLDDRTIQFVPAEDEPLLYTFTYTATNASGLKTTATVVVTVNSVNDAPVANPVAASTPSEKPVRVQLWALDVDGDELTYSIASGPAHGTLSAFDWGQGVMYTPDAGFFGPDSFMYAVSDPSGATATAVASITVQAPTCGDGVLNASRGEECDDGNPIGGDGCDLDCRLSCGSGTGALRATVDRTSGACFAYYSNGQPSFHDAARACREVSGHLPTLTSAEQTNAMLIVAQNNPAWIGLDDIGSEGLFANATRWITGELYSGNFNSFKIQDSTGSEDCMMLPGGFAEDIECGSGRVQGTVCEFDPHEATTAFPTNLTGPGHNPYGIATGDFNNDGYVDVVTGSEASAAFGVFLGDGAGGFGRGTYVSTSGPPISFVAADFNGDGKTDIAVATQNALAVYANNTTPNPNAFVQFSPAWSSSIDARAVVAADFNGDNRVDLASAGYSSGVRIFYNTGSLSFGFFQTQGQFFGNTAMLTTMDLNRDGHIDLAAYDGSAVRVAVNTAGNFGAGGTQFFTGPVVFVPTNAPFSIASGDFDEDGDGDLVLTNMNSTPQTPHLQVVRNDNGSLVYAGGRTLDAAPRTAIVRDVDEDGYDDVVVGNDGMDAISVMYGNGSLMMGELHHFTAGANTLSPAVADLDNDGRLDLLATNWQDDTFTVNLGRDDRGFGLERFATGNIPRAYSNDLNKDGHPDLVITNENQGTVTVRLWVPNVGWAPPRTYATGPGAFFAAFGDFNKDGLADIAVANMTAAPTGTVSVLRGTGGGLFALGATVPVGQRPRAVVVGDFDSNGLDDFATANEISSTVTVALNGGNLSFSTSNISVGSQPLALAVGKVDGNAALDLVVANYGSNSVQLLYGTGAGSFGVMSPVSVGAQPISIALSDLNRNGQTDLAVANSGSSTISLLNLNGGSNLTVVSTVSLNNGVIPWLSAADVNRDGLDDLIVTLQSRGMLQILRNTSIAGLPFLSFATQRFINTEPFPISTALLDLEMDWHFTIVSTSVADNGQYGGIANVWMPMR